MTRCEVILWTRLRKKQLGFVFRRQRPIGPFIVDFYCDELKLVVEVDGVTHIENEAYDASRDQYMRALGIEVIRYTDFKVELDEETVVAEIRLALVRRASELEINRQESPPPASPNKFGSAAPSKGGHGVTRPALGHLSPAE